MKGQDHMILAFFMRSSLFTGIKGNDLMVNHKRSFSVGKYVEKLGVGIGYDTLYMVLRAFFEC